MLRDGSAAIEPCGGDVHEDWKFLHQQLRGIAKRRGELDAKEATYLVEAQQRRIWERVGCVSMLDYMECELGYSPREATMRLRIAKRLDDLTELQARLCDGTFSMSAIRELTRVATPDTEEAWIEAARGKNLRQIEQLVTGHKPGDNPDDDTGPDTHAREVPFELSPQAHALLRQVRMVLADEVGHAVSDDELIETLCRRALEPASGENRPAYQIAVTTCEQCKRGWQNGAGREIEIDAATIELAHCDAEHIGSLEAKTPPRVKTKISKRRRRHVMARDKHRCSVPGCRSSRNLDVHHIVFRMDGGRHELWNLLVLCSGHHRMLHHGLLTIVGRAPDKLTFTFAKRGVVATGVVQAAEEQGSATTCPPVPADATAAAEPARTTGKPAPQCDPVIPADATTALVGLGFSHAEARAALQAAQAHVGREPTLETWIREGLRACASVKPRWGGGGKPRRERATLQTG